MAKKFIILFVSLVGSPLWAANLYVDQTCVDCDGTSTHYDTTTRVCVEGAGVKNYQVFEDALDVMQSGDDVFLRGGNYTPAGRYTASGITNADFYLDYTKVAGSSENHSSIQSYPGEWAVLEGSGTRALVLGHLNQDKTGVYQINYLDISRLEIDGNNTSAGWGGIGLNGSYNTIKYCKIHECRANDGTSGSSGGIIGWIAADWEIKYNWFRNNGGNNGANNCAHIVLVAAYDYVQDNCTTYHWFLDGPYSADYNTKRNEISYNLFENPAGNLAQGAIKHKAKTPYSGILIDNENIVCGSNTITAGEALTNALMTYQDYGDKFHHNLFLDSDGILSDQDFVQIYNNIFAGGDIHIGEERLFIAVHGTAYNNTLIGGSIHWTAPTATYYPATFTEYSLWLHGYNNISTTGAQSGDGYSYWSIAFDLDNAISEKLNDVDFDHNYLYAPQDNLSGIRDVDINDTYYTIASYNSAFSTTNFEKVSSEGTDNLFTGASGADQYITRGEHVISGSTTIADGGIGGNHPYLTGVTLPSYIGATNPDDNSWVAGVLALDSTYFTSATAGSDPAWIEGSDPDPEPTSTTTCTGCTGVGVTFN